MRSIAELEKRIQCLEQENQYLKNLLTDAGISYSVKIIDDNGNEYDPNQGARIIPRDITETDAKMFFSMFWGRTDVYSRRTIKKSTGEVNYYTQCYNFWKNGCPRISGSKVKCQDCERKAYKELKKEQIIEHLKGNSEDATDVIGVFPLLANDTCRFIVFDFDNHGKDAEKSDFANADDMWREEVGSLRKICDMNGIDALVERSRSGRGAHLWIFFQKPIEASLARKFGNALLNKGAESVNLKSFRFYDRMLPMQSHLPKGGVGNLIALPLQGQALREGNSAFIDEHWNAYPDQWEVLLNKKKLSKEFIEDKIKEWAAGNSYTVADCKDIFESDNEKPWNKTKHFQKEDVEGILHITLSNGVYVNAVNLQPRIQNQFRRMAAFANPVFYKNQALKLSNSENYRYIYLGSDEGEFIKVPRGIWENITEECEKAGMDQVTPKESMILIATGKLIGEGFDYPRLDTLIMATSVAWKGVVGQYAGRLNRDYDGKKSVIIYDYVDSHISMFDRMYHKRLKAYKQIGYDIFSGTGVYKQTTNAIFDIDNYTSIYRNDLLAAEKEIIISSPAISGKKVYDMIHLLKGKQEAGIKIVIVTWKQSF